jgi:hypothetical protein
MQLFREIYMPQNKELIERFYISQERNAYFLLAAAASAIGFAITQAKVEPITYMHIPLGLSVLSWAVSFYCGQQFIQWSISAVGKNADYLSNNFLPELPENVKKEAFHKSVAHHARKMRLHGKTQINFLLLGAICYIAYHILKMISAAA